MSRTQIRGDLYTALTEALVPPAGPTLSSEQQRIVVKDTASFVREQISVLPPGLLSLMKVGLAGFRLFIRIRHLRGFCDLPLVTRRAVAARWAYGPLSPARLLFRPIRATALLAYYEHPLVAASTKARA